MGIVYRARDIPNDRDVAIKVVNFGVSSIPNAITEMKLYEYRVFEPDRIRRLNERIAVKPDIVFTTFLDDPHQDHATIAQCAVRTFRSKETVLEYEILRHGSNTFTPSLFVDISSTVDTKVRALQEYKTQLAQRAYFDEESFRSLARTRGAQCGYRYAEGFIVLKLFW